jgi:hypothetical protein
MCTTESDNWTASMLICLLVLQPIEKYEGRLIDGIIVLGFG